MWRLIIPALAIVLLGASFFRAGSAIMVVVCLLLLALLAVPRRWAAQLARFALLAGSGYWLARAWQIGAERAAQGEDYARMAVILGTVAAFTFAAALVLRSRRLQSYYRSEPGAPH